MGNVSDDMLKSHRDMFFSDWDRTITYVTQSRSVNYTTGVATITGSSDSLTCVTRPVSDRQVAGSNGRYFAGDRFFELRTEDLPEDPPSTSSKIIFNGVDYQIISFERSCSDIVTIILGRKNKES